jgi:alpha-L-fucosidase
MKSGISILACVTAALATLPSKGETAKFEATWASLEQVNPVPEWFKDAKFGIYFHWGVYSVPAFANEWYPRHMYMEGRKENRHHIEKYGTPEEWPFHNFITGAKDKEGNFVQFAPKLKSNGGQFDPEEWADLFAKSGAKFAGPVAEHHDGFSMWASDVNPWNAKNHGPGIDLVGVLVDAIRKRDMKIILSMHHAFHCCPGKRLSGKIESFYMAVPKTDDPQLKILYAQLSKEENEFIWLEKHKEIIDRYQPDIIWQDFNLPGVSEQVLLDFLAYYYNKAGEWGKEVVNTYKDAFNKKVGVLDYERGGPADLTDYYWLTDDAISRTSWSYTEGISFYSPKQVLHGFLDRISKNGSLLLNISPKADGTITQEQKDILLAMGDWLGKYGEGVYNTRAWVIYGEGPVKMGSGHVHTSGGEFEEPSEGSADDIRFTRSKDNKDLYAIVLGWPDDSGKISISSLASGMFPMESLAKVSLLGPKAGTYIPLEYQQDEDALHLKLPEKPAEELAYVIKLSFPDKIPDLKVK